MDSGVVESSSILLRAQVFQQFKRISVNFGLVDSSSIRCDRVVIERTFTWRVGTISMIRLYPRTLNRESRVSVKYPWGQLPRKEERWVLQITSRIDMRSIRPSPMPQQKMPEHISLDKHSAFRSSITRSQLNLKPESESLKMIYASLTPSYRNCSVLDRLHGKIHL